MYLYVKTHNITGLKYLGKTTQDPYKYKGSGTYWLRHLLKHGNNVTTEILLMTEDKRLLKETGIYYSNLWNIVESKEWANIVPEQGDGGDTSKSPNHISSMKKKVPKISGSNNYFYGQSHSEETKQKISQSRKGKGKGLKHSEEWILKRKQSGNKNGMYGKDPWNKGKILGPQSAETRRKKGKPLIYNGVEYNSLNEAEKLTGVSSYKIRKNCVFLL